jgi:hypothetical protein
MGEEIKIKKDQKYCGTCTTIKDIKLFTQEDGKIRSNCIICTRANAKRTYNKKIRPQLEKVHCDVCDRDYTEKVYANHCNTEIHKKRALRQYQFKENMEKIVKQLDEDETAKNQRIEQRQRQQEENEDDDTISELIDDTAEDNSADSNLFAPIPEIELHLMNHNKESMGRILSMHECPLIANFIAVTFIIMR